MIAHGTSIDVLGASASANLTVAASGKSGVRTIRRSFYGARLNWSSVIDNTIWGPSLGDPDDFFQIITGPITLGNTLTMMQDARIVGVRLYKSPTATGTIPVGMWDASGNLITSKTVTWTADEGGYREVLWDAPVPVKQDREYNWGYFYPNADTNYAAAIWVWNGQNYTNYPFWQKTLVESGAGIRSHGGWRKAGGSGLTYAGASADRSPTDYYIDPIVEWTDDTPGYDGGGGYYAQWDNSAWLQTNFPIIMFWANLGDYADYVTTGINVMVTGDGATQENIDQFAAQEAAHPGSLKWIPSLVPDEMSGPKSVNDDPVLASTIIGYLIMDEPDLNQNPWYSPDVTLSWKNHARQYDSTRIAWLNLSRYTAINQSFFFAPPGVDMVTKELNIRRYAGQSGIGSLDNYNLAGVDSYQMNVPPGGDNRYGLWTYPLAIKRMREVTDGRAPVYGIVESTSEFPNAPTPSQVDRAVWSMLIAGAKGIQYFDHRFPDSDVTQDFGAYLRDAPMKAQITSTNARIQTLKNALLAPDAGLIESYTSSGTLLFAQGGYAIGARRPMHFTSRVAGGTTYLFAQVIRDGATTATFFAPSLAGATLTVIGEGRTITIDGTGHFTDTFAADYQYHLYSTATAPTYVIPANTLAPLLYSDGTPQPGDTLTCAVGGWTGSCLRPTEYYVPQFEYQWQKDGTNVVGAVFGSYLVQSGDQGHAIRCVVRATNPAGSATANSNALTILAPDAQPVNTVAPALTTDGTPQTGETISCSQGTWVSTLTPSFVYQWQRDGANIVGETSSTHLLTIADQSHVIRCVVTATNTSGSTSANSNAVTPTAAPAPTNSVAPTITGSTSVGSSLTCAAGTWTGSPSFAFQWQRGVSGSYSNLSGETASTYTVALGDVGNTLRCVVTASNGAGSASANSNAVTATAASSSYASVVMADSPFAYYRLADLTDSSGGGRTLTVVDSAHAPTFVAGLISDPNQAAQIDGFGQLSRASDAGLQGITAGITMEAWFKYSTGPYPVALLKLGKNLLFVRDNAIGSRVAVGGGTAYQLMEFPTTLVEGVVYHVVATYDLSDTKLYLDGAQVASFNAPHGAMDSATTALLISGGDPDYFSLTGVVDEFALYNHPISGARVAVHHSTGTGGGGGGGGGALSLPRVAWDGGPDYWTVAHTGTQMTKAEAAGMSDPSFFPIGVWSVKQEPEYVAAYQSIGINIALTVESSDNGSIAPITDAGMLCICTVDNPNTSPAERNWRLTDVGSNPLVVGWMLGDEFDQGLGGFVGSDNENGWLASMQSRYNVVNAYNDGRFKWTNFGNGIALRDDDGSPNRRDEMWALVDGANGDKYVYTDPISREEVELGVPWPTSIPDGGSARAGTYGYLTENMRDLTGQSAGVAYASKPVFPYIETKLPYIDRAPNPPYGSEQIITYNQLEGAIWSSIANEARGIAYFQMNGFYGSGTHAPTTDPNTGAAPVQGDYSLAPGITGNAVDSGLIARVTQINARVTELAPVLNTQSYVWNFGATGIDTMLKAPADGFAYIFASVAIGGATGSKTFTLPTELAAATSVTVLYESRTITASGGSFSDSFAQEYSHHIYKIAVP